MLKVKLLNPLATVPTIGHPGEDLGYDIYALRIQSQPVQEDGTPVRWIPSKPGMPTKLDLTGKIVRPIRLESGKPTIIETGIAVHFEGPQVLDGSAEQDEAPVQQYGLLIRDRSSMAEKGIFVTAGVVDAGYRGELKIILNLSSGSYQDLWPGDKIAQLIPIPVYADKAQAVAEFDKVTARGEDGFGSTGN